MVQEKFERLHVALPTSAGIPFTTRMELPPRQSGHRISNRISNKPETMNTDTPRTNEALAAILDKDGYLSEDNAPDVLVKLSRTMEQQLGELTKLRSALIRINDAVAARLRAGSGGDERLELLRASEYVREVLQHNADMEVRSES